MQSASIVYLFNLTSNCLLLVITLSEEHFFFLSIKLSIDIHNYKLGTNNLKNNKIFASTKLLK